MYEMMRNKAGRGNEGRSGKAVIWLLVLLAAAACLLGAGYLFLKTYTIRTVYVEGNVHYTQEEIETIVMEGPFGHNSLYLSFKYRKKGVEDIPFVDVMDVNILSPDTIKITVYEKALAGYVKYMDSYLYFDKDGYVVECSSVITAGIPQIVGRHFDHVVLGEMLPVEDTDIFNSVMSLTKLMDKYDLTADKIFFHSTGEITIYFGQIKVALGSNSRLLEEKVMRLPELLGKVEGKSGTFRMENYSEDNTNIPFELDNTGS